MESIVNFYFTMNANLSEITISQHTVNEMLKTENGRAALDILNNMSNPLHNRLDKVNGYMNWRVNTALSQVNGILLHFGGIEAIDLSADNVPADALWRRYHNNKDGAASFTRRKAKAKAQRY